LLDQRLTLLWPGQRTAPQRQKTLHATLESSYALLSDAERMVLLDAEIHALGWRMGLLNTWTTRPLVTVGRFRKSSSIVITLRYTSLIRRCGAGSAGCGTDATEGTRRETIVAEISAPGCIAGRSVRYRHS
jgi:hypothetical protein